MEEDIATVEIINFFNDLFSVNSSEVKKNDLRSPVIEDSTSCVLDKCKKYTSKYIIRR